MIIMAFTYTHFKIKRIREQFTQKRALLNDANVGSRISQITHDLRTPLQALTVAKEMGKKDGQAAASLLEAGFPEESITKQPNSLPKISSVNNDLTPTPNPKLLCYITQLPFSLLPSSLVFLALVASQEQPHGSPKFCSWYSSFFSSFR